MSNPSILGPDGKPIGEIIDVRQSKDFEVQARSTTDALAKLEEAVANEPKPNVTHKGPHPTPIPKSARKKARLREKAGRRAARGGR